MTERHLGFLMVPAIWCLLLFFFINSLPAAAETQQKLLTEAESELLFKNASAAYDAERELMIKNAKAAADKERGGQWAVQIKNSGVSAMHMALLPNSKIIIFDRSHFGPSNISLPFGKCRLRDCWGHSIEYDVDKNKVRPLKLETDTWSSSGAMSPDGHLIQTGGINDGDQAIRTFIPCDFCDWTEDLDALAKRRWRATDQILPDGRIIIFGGRRQFNYEFVPRNQGNSFYDFPFLQESLDSDENNLYPFVHLSPDGNLFIFANKKSILFDYANNRVLRRYPDMPGNSRNYPNSGSSVLLPLDSGAVGAEVLICGGGGAASAYSEAKRGNFLNASNTCGRLRFTEPDDPQWQMEDMPMPRVMGDMVLLATGDVLIINGASKGSAGLGNARDPVLHPLLYKPRSKSGPDRFEVLNPSVTPRLYQSTCHVLPDGRVLVGGSNPNLYYNFTDVLYPTDLSLEAFSPPYLAAENDEHRPLIAYLVSNVMGYGHLFTFSFLVETLVGKDDESLSVTLLAPSFNTHSYSMNQRLLRLQIVHVLKYIVDFGFYEITVMAPPHAALAPPGYYLLFVVHAGIPSYGKWVKLSVAETFY